MTVTNVVTNKLEGQLAISSASGTKYAVFMGPASKGTASTPITLSRASDVVSTFGYGPVVQDACHAIEFYGQPVIIIRTPATGTAAAIALTTTAWAGTSAVTADGTTAPIDDFEFVLKIVAGGTIGTAGITFQYSYDAGRSFSPITALGTANTYTFLMPDGTSSGIVLDFASGTAVAADVVTGACACAIPNAADLTASLTAIKNSALDWETLCASFPAASTVTDALNAHITACVALGRSSCYFVAHAAAPAAGVPDATYQAAVIAAFASSAYSTGIIVAGAVRQTSSVPRFAAQMVRSPAGAIAALTNALPIHVSPAQPTADHVLPNCKLVDENNNVADRTHDEYLNPGLDAAGFCVVRTWPRSAGVWVNLPTMHCASGSDFNRLPKLRVWGRFAEALFDFFKLRIQAPVLVNASTGKISEPFAAELEKSAQESAGNAVMQAPSASAIQVRVSRTDDLLSAESPTLTVSGTIVPLGYPDQIELNLGFAVTIQKV